MPGVPIFAELITAQFTDADFRIAFTSVGKLDTRFSFDSDGVLVLFPCLDAASQRVIPASLRLYFAHLCYYSLLAHHPVERRMYHSMKKQLFFPFMDYWSIQPCSTIALAH